MPVKRAQRSMAKQERAAAKATAKPRGRSAAADSFQNMALSLGIGSDSAMSAGSYGFNPITRQRILLEWIYRGSWLGGVAVDVVADDMTRAGIEVLTEMDPKEVEDLQRAMVRRGVWTGLNETCAWGRLYGGAIGVFLVDGQNMATPLDVTRVGRGRFKGMMVLDRWMVEPSLTDLVTDLGPELGQPRFYKVSADAPGLPRATIHHTRVVRFDGIRLPYWQRVSENLWGMSVLERLYDRMIAFDSATTGAAQLAYKSFLRTYKVDGMRALMAAGGESAKLLVRYVDMMRRFQSNEGVTLLDAKDDMVVQQQPNFTGIGEVIDKCGEQLSGALQIPLVRLFGQSPAGLNSTGESDLRTYYDGINQAQEKTLRIGVDRALRITAQSEGIELPGAEGEDEFWFNFRPLWQLSEAEKSEVSQRDTDAALAAEERGIITPRTALQELRTMSRTTGRFTNITDKMIEDADDEPAPRPEDIAGLGAGIGEEKGGGPQRDPQLEPAAKAPKATGGDRAPIIITTARQGMRTVDALPASEVCGVQLAIEYPAGSQRPNWRGSTVTMPADYGYLRRVPSAEGPEEWMDCIVGPNRESDRAFIVDAYGGQTGAFSEHKIMLGFDTPEEALRAFNGTYPQGDLVARAIIGMPGAVLRNWLATADVTRPASEQPVVPAVAVAA